MRLLFVTYLLALNSISLFASELPTISEKNTQISTNYGTFSREQADRKYNELIQDLEQRRRSEDRDCIKATLPLICVGLVWVTYAFSLVPIPIKDCVSITTQNCGSCTSIGTTQQYKIPNNSSVSHVSNNLHNALTSICPNTDFQLHIQAQPCINVHNLPSLTSQNYSGWLNKTCNRVKREKTNFTRKFKNKLPKTKSKKWHR